MIFPWKTKHQKWFHKVLKQIWKLHVTALYCTLIQRHLSYTSKVSFAILCMFKFKHKLYVYVNIMFRYYELKNILFYVCSLSIKLLCFEDQRINTTFEWFTVLFIYVFNALKLPIKVRFIFNVLNTTLKMKMRKKVIRGFWVRL